MEDKLFGAKVAIEESEKYLKEQIDSVETFKTHQSRMLTSLSLIISVIGLIIGLQEERIVITHGIFIMIGVLFLAFVAIYTLLVMPISVEMPIKTDFDVYKEIFFDKPEKRVLENKLENYLLAVKKNRRKINRLVYLSRISTVLYLVLIVLSLGMIFLSIW